MQHEHLARRYEIVRNVVSLAGDLATGVAVAAACSWLIQQATLGMFLSFLIWLLGVVIGLALSQHVVHPTVQWALADDKLDRGLALATCVRHTVVRAAQELDLAEVMALLRRTWPTATARPAPV